MYLVGKKSKNLILAQEQLDRVLLKPEVLNSIEEIRAKWNIEIGNSPDQYLESYDFTNNERFERLLSNDEFSNDIGKVLMRYKLHKSWHDTIAEYAYWDEVDLRLNPYLDPNATEYRIG